MSRDLSVRSTDLSHSDICYVGADKLACDYTGISEISAIFDIVGVCCLLPYKAIIRRITKGVTAIPKCKDHFRGQLQQPTILSSPW